MGLFLFDLKLLFLVNLHPNIFFEYFDLVLSRHNLRIMIRKTRYRDIPAGYEDEEDVILYIYLIKFDG